MARGIHALMLVTNPVRHDPRVRNEAEALSSEGIRITAIGWDRSATSNCQYDLGSTQCVVLGQQGLLRHVRPELVRLFFIWKRIARQATTLFQKDPYDLIHAHDLDTLPAAVRLGRRFGIPVVYDAHEDFPAMMRHATWLPWGIRHMVRWLLPPFFESLERRLLPQVSRTVTVCDAAAEMLRRRGAPDDPLVVLNAKQPPEFVPLPPHDPLRVAYIGGISPARMVPDLLEAIQDLKGVRLVLAGPVIPAYTNEFLAKVDATPNAEYLGVIPHDEVLAETQNAHAAVCPLDAMDPLFKEALPNKMFEALATGRGFVTTTGTAAGSFTARHDTGIAAPPTVSGLREAFTTLRDNRLLLEGHAANALRLAKEGPYNWAAQVSPLVDLYFRLIPNP